MSLPGGESLLALVECLCSELEATGAGPVCWCGLYPGGVPAWDYCDSCDAGTCGMAYVSVVQVQPYTTFGAQDFQATCATGLQAVLRVGALRCLPLNDDGSLPAPADMAESALALHADALAIRAAVSCCLPASTILQGWTALPAQGGCTGGEWIVVLDLEP